MNESKQFKWIELYVHGVEVDVRIRCEFGATKEEQKAIAYETLCKVIESNEEDKTWNI